MMTRRMKCYSSTHIAQSCVVCFTLLLALGFQTPGLMTTANAQVYALPEQSPAWVKGYRVRFMVRVAGNLDKPTAKSIIVTLPASSWLKADGSDVIAQSADGKTIPAGVLSHDPKGDTIVQFERQGNQQFYWVYAGNPNVTPVAAPRFEEGLIYEVRQWQGDDVTSWASVRQGLMKSDNVIGNGLATMLFQNANPARPGNPQNFAASYRGYLRIPTDGTYRFFANTQDAAFFFMDGLIVDQRPAMGQQKTGKIVLDNVGSLIDLKAGVHPIELHHIMGTNPQAFGFATLLYVPPDSKKISLVPPTLFVQAMYGQVVNVEQPNPKTQTAFINLGIEDVLLSGQTELYLVRFEASGNITDPDKITWDFGDGTRGVGRSVTHVYFKQGDYTITLNTNTGLPASVRHLHVWPVPGQSSPLTLSRAVESFDKSDWKNDDNVRLQHIYEFLINCEQPNRWPLVEAMSRFLMSRPMTDARLRATQYAMLMRALAQQGKADEASSLLEPALQELGKIRSLEVELKLAAARVYDMNLRQPDTAANIYQEIIDKYSRQRLPGVRDAAVALGDLYLRSGNTEAAANNYRVAQTLSDQAGESSTEATTRGALLRTAEQQLRDGNVRESGKLLDKIAVDYPQQKLEGLYRFLRAESDRVGGRYEEAIYSYEVLLKLDHWAGFRNRALFGIADSYRRMGELDEALRWLSVVETSFPDYFKSENIAAYRKDITQRQERIASGQDAQSFESVTVNFDPNDPVDKAKWGSFAFPRFGVVSSPAFAGNGAVILDNFVATAYWEYSQRVRNISNQGYYWVEFWYRTSLEPPRILADMHVHVYLSDTQKQSIDEGKNRTNLSPTLAGAWERVGFLLRPPMTQDGLLMLSFRHAYGFTEIDGLTITSVSDRAYDAFQNFVDGTPEQ